jgi:dihydroflavonol-4-reductase
LKQVIPELNRERNVSNEKARRVLGWQPRSAEEAILSGAKSLIEHKAV